MNQLFDILPNRIIIQDLITYYSKQAYYSVFAITKIKNMNSDNYIGWGLLLSNLIISKTIKNIYLLEKLLPYINFQYDKVFFEVHNKFGLSRTICTKITPLEILDYEDNMGDDKFNGSFGSNMLLEIKIESGDKNDITDIKDKIIGVTKINDDVLLSDILNVYKINYDNNSNLKIEYLDLDSGDDNEKNISIIDLNDKGIFELLEFKST
jgi:hypothetical protein